MRGTVTLISLVLFALPVRTLAQPSGKAQDMPLSLTGVAGDTAKGRALAWARDRGNCVACHVIPGPDVATHGNLGPSLRGVGDRLSEGQIRLRVVDARAVDPGSLMPSYHRTEGLKRVANNLAGQPVLSAQEVEDMVAFMLSLREGKP